MIVDSELDANAGVGCDIGCELVCVVRIELCGTEGRLAAVECVNRTPFLLAAIPRVGEVVEIEEADGFDICTIPVVSVTWLVSPRKRRVRVLARSTVIECDKGLYDDTVARLREQNWIVRDCLTKTK